MTDVESQNVGSTRDTLQSVVEPLVGSGRPSRVDRDPVPCSSPFGPGHTPETRKSRSTAGLDYRSDKAPGSPTTTGSTLWSDV